MDTERMKELRFKLEVKNRSKFMRDYERQDNADLIALIDEKIARIDSTRATDEGYFTKEVEKEANRKFEERCENTGININDTVGPPDEAVKTFESFLSSRYDESWVGNTVSNQYLYASIIIALRQMQQPTDEAVKDAVGWMESAKKYHEREWQKQDIERQMAPVALEQHESFMQAFDLVITAMRQYRAEILTTYWFQTCPDCGYVSESIRRPAMFCPNCGKLLPEPPKDGE